MGKSKEALVDRTKVRIASVLATAALASGIFVASPARAAETCHPLPQVYCNVITYLNDCVFWPPPAEYCDS